MKKGIVVNIKNMSITETPGKGRSPGEFIVKVQRSLASTFEAIAILIYDEKKLHEEQFDETDDLPRVVECLGRLGNRPKAYFNAQLNETGIKLLEEVEDPNW